jgi:hypothetical protein
MYERALILFTIFFSALGLEEVASPVTYTPEEEVIFFISAENFSIVFSVTRLAIFPFYLMFF